MAIFFSSYPFSSSTLSLFFQTSRIYLYDEKNIAKHFKQIFLQKKTLEKH